MAIVKFDQDGHTLSEHLFELYPQQFRGARPTLGELRLLAAEITGFALRNGPVLTDTELREKLETFLHNKGWKGPIE